jgi:AcrR family transcriptional regulator
MPRTPHDNELIRAARREEILGAAGRVFAKKGFAATKIADIAAEAGLSYGLLYHYFRSKEDVYAGLVDELVERSPLRAASAVDAASGPLERLRVLVGLLLARTAERPELAVLFSQALLGESLPPATRSRLLRQGWSTYERIVELVRAAQRSGEAADDERAEELALAIVAMLRGLGTMRFFVRSSPAPSVALPSVSADTVLRVLRPAAAPPRARAAAASTQGATKAEAKRPTRRRPAKERRRAA